MISEGRHLDRVKYPRTWFRSRKGRVAEIRKLLASLRTGIDKGLHLGCGGTKLPGLINCDLHDPNADLKANATELTMFEDGSIDLIESHHMIEHLSFEDTERAFAEWHRVLRAGGLVVLTFPDITAVSLKWLVYTMAYPVVPRPDKLDYIVKMFVGSQEHPGMFHKNAFDLRRMSRTLSKHGFDVEFTVCPYPMRPTPSRLVIARKRRSFP
ncbi:MAG: methyltransferase domain-containing protein [Verrucomicrobia bacterium]|nr:methyltransferase domain-containing protein [Verrucomicrobiota bacterium]